MGLFNMSYCKQDENLKNDNKVFFYDINDVLVEEKIELMNGLRFLYKNSLGGFCRKIVKKGWVSSAYGWFNKTIFSKSKIKRYIKKYNINMDHFQSPPNGKYKSFNDFFTRKLKPGARDIDFDSHSIIAPADSKMLAFSEVSQGVRFFVKSKPFELETFLQNKELADRYQNGTLLIFRLAPCDYHRYHFPLDCVPSIVRKIDGQYDSVNPIVFRAGNQPLQTNKRNLTILKTKQCSDVVMVAVGAMFIGTIIETYKPEVSNKKGEEVGYFAVGGSTIVLLFEKGKIKVDQKVLDRSKENYETEVKMGQPVAKIVTF